LGALFLARPGKPGLSSDRSDEQSSDEQST
jgi:hypothetical protein